jgi:DNA-binding transcriptional regulator YbjK
VRRRRRGPVPAEVRAVRDAERAVRRAERSVRRSEEIARAVADLIDRDALAHEAVAERAGVPLGYLLWAYPDLDALSRAALPAAS